MKNRRISIVCLILVAMIISLTVGCDNLTVIGTKGGTTKYSDAPTEVTKLWVKFSSDMAPVTYEVYQNGNENCYIENDKKVVIDDDTYGLINQWVDDYNIRSWDGFDMERLGVMDGSSFRLEIDLATGERITAFGKSAFPDGYHEAKEELISILDTMKYSH